jgi:WD40 repeat protein
VETGEILQRLEGHQSAVYDAQFSRDGRYALSGSLDLTLILWDLETGQKIRQFEGHTGDVFSVGFSNDGHTAISSSFDGTIRLWNVDSGAELLRYDGHQGGVRSVAFSPDNHTFISASEDTTLREWRVDSFDEVILWAYDNRYIPELSCEQRQFYRIGTQCNAADIFVTRTPYLTPAPSAIPTLLSTIEGTEAINEPAATTTPTLTPLVTVVQGVEIHSEMIPGSRDLYTYEGHTDEIVSIQVNADQPANEVTDETAQIQQELLDTQLTLFRPDGSILASNDDLADGQTDSEITGVQLPTNGQYIIQVYNPASSEVGGGYTLVIKAGTLATSEPLGEVTEIP